MKKVLLVLICTLFLSFNSHEITHKSKPLTKQNVWLAINDLEIKYPEIVFAQAMLESAELKSDLARNNNNLFGMKIPKKRSTTAVGSRRGYAVYTHWTESLKDYKLYQEYILERKTIVSVHGYVLFLNRSYAEIGDYDRRIRRVLTEHKSLIDGYVEDQEPIQPN